MEVAGRRVSQPVEPTGDSKIHQIYIPMVGYSSG